MASAMYRKAMWFRVATLCLAFVFVVGFTGIGAAVPAPKGDHGEKTESGDVSPPDADAVVEIDEKAPAALDPKTKDESPAEPAPADLGATEEIATAEPVAVQPAVVEPAAIVPSVQDIQVTPAVSVDPATSLDLSSNLMGWNSETGEWVNGNLGKKYNEGDWVTYRITIENKRDVSKSLPAFGIEYDYYKSTPSPAGIGVDKTKEWTFAPSTTPLANPLTDPLPGVSITPTSDDDALMPGTIPSGTSARHVVRFDESVSNTLVVPENGTVIIYFRAHLSITAWWQQQAGLDGSASYPGSSAQMAMNGVGAQTVPIPVPPAPESMVNGLKFYDEAPLGTYEGEGGIDDWDFTLRGGSDGFFYTLNATSADGGEFNFGPLPPGAYSLTEEISAPWASAYP
ncbi:MAG: hypothetical protein PF636_06255, partial [Actinomycetota bacterium]|nr:hypothetical protein [Actinomycetota bacterium]